MIWCVNQPTATAELSWVFLMASLWVNNIFKLQVRSMLFLKGTVHTWCNCLKSFLAVDQINYCYKSELHSHPFSSFVKWRRDNFNAFIKVITTWRHFMPAQRFTAVDKWCFHLKKFSELRWTFQDPLKMYRRTPVASSQQSLKSIERSRSAAKTWNAFSKCWKQICTFYAKDNNLLYCHFEYFRVALKALKATESQIFAPQSQCTFYWLNLLTTLFDAGVNLWPLWE